MYSVSDTRGMNTDKYVRFKEPPSSSSMISSSSSSSSVSASRTRSNINKKVLVVHWQDSVRRIAYTEKAPADAIEQSIRRECRLDQSIFSLLDSDGDSVVIDGSMEPGDVWLNTESNTFDRVKKNRSTMKAARPVEQFTSNLGHILTENAIQHTFDPETKKWTEKPIQVKIDSESFASGSLRKAYYLKILSEPDEIYVAKVSIDPNEDKQTYFQDVETQMYAKKYAEKFNMYKPPKKVDFVMASLLSFPDRPTQSLWALEKHIAGQYRKHNNNFGYVSEAERSTPQAFSHFTYEASNHKALICDIQGVADLYTDPQMHTEESIGISLGKGNLGTRGFQRFLQTHQCNAICQYLKLPLVNTKSLDVGTRPDTPLMSYQQIDVVNLDLYASGDNSSLVSRNIFERQQLLMNNGSQQYVQQQQQLPPPYVQASRTTEDKASSRSCCVIL